MLPCITWKKDEETTEPSHDNVGIPPTDTQCSEEQSDSGFFRSNPRIAMEVHWSVATVKPLFKHVHEISIRVTIRWMLLDKFHPKTNSTPQMPHELSKGSGDRTFGPTLVLTCTFPTMPP